MHGYPAVADVAVVGRPDPTWGETVAAFVRPAPGATVTEGELHAYCRQQLSAFKTPRHLDLRRGIPLTASGKVRKNVLREQLTHQL